MKTNSVEQTLAFGITHGSTHLTLNEKLWHENNLDTKWFGETNYANSGDVIGCLTQKGEHLTDFFQVGRAVFTRIAHIRRFGDKEPSANYHEKPGMETIELKSFELKSE